MTRTQQLIEDKYPGQLENFERLIEIMKLDYDQDEFLEEDIIENILITLNII